MGWVRKSVSYASRTKIEPKVDVGTRMDLSIAAVQANADSQIALDHTRARCRNSSCSDLRVECRWYCERSVALAWAGGCSMLRKKGRPSSNSLLFIAGQYSKEADIGSSE